jgi:hypothetical protein
MNQLSLVSSFLPWWHVLIAVIRIDSLFSLSDLIEAIYFVCAANRRTHKGSSAQLTTIGLDTSYVRNAVQTVAHNLPLI